MNADGLAALAIAVLLAAVLISILLPLIRFRTPRFPLPAPATAAHPS